VVLSASGATGNGTPNIALGSLGPTGSSFMTAPTLITITNNGTLAASEVALQLSDQNNNNLSLEGETWACLYSNGSVFVNEPLTTVKGYGQVAIHNLTLAPGATDSYTVVYYAGSRENTGCGRAFTGYSATPHNRYHGHHNSSEPFPTGRTNSAAASLTNPAEDGTITPTVTVTFSAASIPTPTVAITNIPTSAIYGGSFHPTFTTSGDGTVFTATSTTPSVCTVNGGTGTVNYVGVGTCTLTASVAATTDYTAATGSPQSFLVAPATPTVSITNIPTSAIYGGSFLPTFITSGNGTVFTATSTTLSVCTVSATGTVNYVGVGTCTLTASVGATTDYTAATGSPQSFLVAPATPTVSITNMPTSFTVGGSFNPTFTTSGDGTVFTATSTTPSVCTVSATGTVHFVGTGTCSLTATVAATTDYTTASSTATTQSSSAPATPLSTPTVSITNIPSSATYGGSFLPTFITSGNGTVFTATSTTLSVCTVSATGTVHFVGTGTCTLTASVAATTDYTAATGSPQSFLVAPATPTVSITNMPVSARKGGSFNPTFTTSGDGTVFTATSTTPSVCTVSATGTVHFVGTGTCSLTATVAATTDYTTASSTATTQSSSAAKTTPSSGAAKLPPVKIPSSAPGTGGGAMARFAHNAGLLAAGGSLVFAGLAAMTLALRRRRLSSRPKS
jgi:hypothetical protein